MDCPGYPTDKSHSRHHHNTKALNESRNQYGVKPFEQEDFGLAASDEAAMNTWMLYRPGRRVSGAACDAASAALHPTWSPRLVGYEWCDAYVALDDGQSKTYFGLLIQSRQRYKAFKEMMEPNSARREAHILTPRDPSWKLQRIAEQLNQPVLLICRDIAVASGGRLAQGLRKIGAAGSASEVLAEALGSPEAEEEEVEEEEEVASDAVACLDFGLAWRQTAAELEEEEKEERQFQAAERGKAAKEAAGGSAADSDDDGDSPVEEDEEEEGQEEEEEEEEEEEGQLGTEEAAEAALAAAAAAEGTGAELQFRLSQPEVAGAVQRCDTMTKTVVSLLKLILEEQVDPIPTQHCIDAGLPAPHWLESAVQREAAKSMLRAADMLRLALEPLGIEVTIMRQEAYSFGIVLTPPNGHAAMIDSAELARLLGAAYRHPLHRCTSRGGTKRGSEEEEPEAAPKPKKTRTDRKWTAEDDAELLETAKDHTRPGTGPRGKGRMVTDYRALGKALGRPATHVTERLKELQTEASGGLVVALPALWHLVGMQLHLGHLHTLARDEYSVTILPLPHGPVPCTLLCMGPWGKGRDGDRVSGPGQGVPATLPAVH
ncbi:hypothetical protein ABPG77_001617 [Micractinium sp. CCAP 211/92]